VRYVLSPYITQTCFAVEVLGAETAWHHLVKSLLALNRHYGLFLSAHFELKTQRFGNRPYFTQRVIEYYTDILGYLCGTDLLRSRNRVNFQRILSVTKTRQPLI
jgi:hypothetical protein